MRMLTRSSDPERSHELVNQVYKPGRFTRDGGVQGEGVTRTRGYTGIKVDNARC